MRKDPPIEIIRMPDYRYISRRLHTVHCEYEYYTETTEPRISFGRILIENEQGLQGLLDLQGREVLPCQYDEIDEYSDRFIKISRPRAGEKTGRKRDEYGQREVELTTEDVGKPLMDALRGYEERYYGILDVDGNVILPCSCTEIMTCAEYKNPKQDRFIYCLNSRWGVCDLAGNEILPPEFDRVEGMVLCVASRPSHQANAVFEQAFARVMVFIVRKGTVWGAYDINGEELIPCNKEKIECVPSHQQYPQAQSLIYLERGTWINVDDLGRRMECYTEEMPAEAEQPVILEFDERIDASAHCFYGNYGELPMHELKGKIVMEVVGENEASAQERMEYQDENGHAILEAEYTWIEPIGKRLLAAEHHLHQYGGRYQVYDEKGQAVFPEDVRSFIYTCTNKIVAIPYNGENVGLMECVFFFDEETMCITKQTAYTGFLELPAAAPYYRVSTGRELNDTWRYGLADGDGKIVLPIEYEHFLDANDYRVDTSFFARKEGDWYLIRVCRECF